MDVTFGYKDEGKCFFGKILRPIAIVSFQNESTKKWLEIAMVVDTGADFSILPKYFSEDLGISLEKDCIKDSTVGVGGEQTIYLLKNRTPVKVGSISRDVPLAFFAGDEVPPLLGRLGFLETFDVEFLKSHTIVFKP
ncbi:MAG: retropepsin-like aspartic protease [Patescibacteria group bacterium]